MMDDVSDIGEYYDSQIEREDERLDRHQLEHELTWRYLEQYLPPNGAILEVGAATGRYTVELARRGFAVTAVDLTASLLARCAQNLQSAGVAERVRLVQADARDLAAVEGHAFDAALLMGPLYHLIYPHDRQQAITQAFERLKPGGVLFSAFICRYGILGDLLKKMPGWVEDEQGVRALLETGARPEGHPRGGFRGYFARPQEVAPLHEALGFSTLALAGVEPGISADDESYNALNGELRQRWLELLYAISQEPSVVGASRHLLYVGRKPGAGQETE